MIALSQNFVNKDRRHCKKISFFCLKTFHSENQLIDLFKLHSIKYWQLTPRSTWFLRNNNVLNQWNCYTKMSLLANH